MFILIVPISTEKLSRNLESVEEYSVGKIHMTDKSEPESGKWNVNTV